MDKDFKDKLIEIINSNNFNEKLKTLTYDEKVKIFFSSEYTCSYFRSVCEEKKAILLNEEEVKRLISTNEKIFRFSAFKDDRINICEIPDYYLYEEYNKTKDFNAVLNMKDKNQLIEHVATCGNKMAPFFHGKVSDEIIEIMVNDYRNQSKDRLFSLIVQFKSDKYRIKYLNKLASDYRYHIITEKIEDDKLKKKYINLFTKDKGSIIASLKDDNDKIKYLKKYSFVLSSKEKGIIFSSFDDKNIIKENFKYIVKERDKAVITQYCYQFLPDFFEKEILKSRDEKVIADFLITYYTYSIRINRPIDKNLVKELVNRVNNDSILYDLLSNVHKVSLRKEVLPKLSSVKLEKYVKENMGFSLPIRSLLYLKNDKLFFEAIRSTEFNIKYNSDFLPIFERFSKKYNLNLNHLVDLAKITNCSILTYFNDKIKKTVDLDDESFNKYINIFKEENRNLSMEQINTILVSILHKSFELKFPSEVQIYSGTIIDIRNNNIDYALGKINKVLKLVNLDDYNIDIFQLVDGVINEDRNMLDLYNEMTHKYLVEKRNSYINSNMEKALDSCTKWKFEKNNFLKYFIRLYETKKIVYSIKGIIGQNDKYSFLKNDDLLKEIIEFKKGNIDYSTISNEAKNSIKDFEKVFLDLLDREIYFYTNLDTIDLNKTYSPNLDNLDRSILNIMTNIDIDKLNDTVFKDEEKYKQLMSYLKKYGVIAWNDNFNGSDLHNDVSFTTEVVASFISNYSMIYNERKLRENSGEEVSLMSDFALAQCLDSSSSIYSYLLGSDNFEYISRNPKPFSSPESKEKRIERAIELLKKLHDRDTITVPPIDEDIELENGKKINICLGRTNDPINLTMGERTGSCMRIGGVASTLLEFCLFDENGFHVTFNNPDTGELISRVSCFRNGNTLFLNQLRYSIDSNYSNDDVKKACKIMACKVIELTKDSDYPVENVVASNGYALENEIVTNLNCNNILEGLPNIYTDIKKKAVILATKNNGELLPIKTGPSNCEKYKIIRQKVKKYDRLESINGTGHIESLDQLYMGKDIDRIVISDKGEIDYSYIGEDWYIVVKKDGKVLSYIQNNSHDRNKATEEMTKYLNIVKQSLSKSNNTEYNSLNLIKSEEIYNNERNR